MKISKALFLIVMIPAATLFAQGPGRPGGGGGGRPGGQPGGGRPGSVVPGGRPGAPARQPERGPGGIVVVPGPGRPADPFFPGPGPVPGRIDPFYPGPGPGPAPVIVVPRRIEIISPAEVYGPAEVVQPVVITEQPATATTVETKTAETAAVTATPLKAGDYQLVLLEDTSEEATPAICYKAGEDMKFKFSVNKLVDKPVEGKLFLKWKRTGDDGRIDHGLTEISEDKAVSLVTSIDRPDSSASKVRWWTRRDAT